MAMLVLRLAFGFLLFAAQVLGTAVVCALIVSDLPDSWFSASPTWMFSKATFAGLLSFGAAVAWSALFVKDVSDRMDTRP